MYTKLSKVALTTTTVSPRFQPNLFKQMSKSKDLGESKYFESSMGRIRYNERGNGHPIIFFHGALNNGGNY